MNAEPQEEAALCDLYAFSLPWPVRTANASFLERPFRAGLNRPLSVLLSQLPCMKYMQLLPRKLACGRSCSERLHMALVAKETRAFSPVNVQSSFLIRNRVNSALKGNAVGSFHTHERHGKLWKLACIVCSLQASELKAKACA